jgi:hypothetical protein
MADAGFGLLREQLVGRRNQLVDVMHQPDAAVHLRSLLAEVDAALDRGELGTFGQGETRRTGRAESCWRSAVRLRSRPPTPSAEAVEWIRVGGRTSRPVAAPAAWRTGHGHRRPTS